MANLNQYKAQVEESDSLKLVIDALGEVATIQFRQTRDGIEHNTLFFSEIGKVYHALKLMAEKRRLEAHLKSDKNGRNVSILLTSNSRFHGGLDAELSNYFLESVGKYPTDVIVIGQSGEKFLKAVGFKHPLKPINFKSDSPTTAEVLSLTELVKPYSKILVYHSKFVTILDQQVDIADLTQSEAAKEAATSQINYIIEPELPKMLEFFEGQILTSLFQSVFLESELAKTAARMVSMDTAGLNAEKIIAREKTALLRARKNIQNIRILESFVQIKNLGREDGLIV